MKPSVTIVFILLFLAVAAAYTYFRPLEKPAAPPPVAYVPPEPMRLLPLEEGDGLVLMQIQDLARNQTMTLTRGSEKENWMLKYPVAYIADPLIADGMAKSLTMTSRARRLTPEKDWSEYGLDKPKMKIGIETRKNRTRRYLVFGAHSPVANLVYARWEGAPDYFLIDAALPRVFDKTVYTMRWKRVFRIRPAAMTKIHILTPGGEYELAKRGGNWLWVEPIPILGEKISRRSMDEFLRHLSELFIKEFLDEEKRSKDQLGFTVSRTLIEVWQDPAKDPAILHVGAELPKKDAFYGYLEKEDVYFWVARDNIRLLLETITALAETAKTHRVA